MTPTRTMNFCPECGAKASPDDRFCGGCGAPLKADTSTVFPPRQKAPPETSRGNVASRAALFLGGWWTIGNKVDGRGAKWLAQIGSFAMVPFLFFVLLWWYAFLFRNRHNLSANELETAVILLAISSALAILAAVPLSRRAARLEPVNNAAQRRQMKLGVSIHILALALSLSYWVTNQAIADSIGEARSRAGAGRQQKDLYDFLDKVPQRASGDGR